MILTNPKSKFCSNFCQKKSEYSSYITRWLNGLESGTGKSGVVSKHVRKYLMEKHNSSCSKCGWDKVHPESETSPLEIHHIDGNAYDSSPDNIELLCPNCHALTLNYRARNKRGQRVHRTASAK